MEEMEATIVTHNPGAFEMEQHHFEREEDLGCGLAVYTLMGFGVKLSLSAPPCRCGKIARFENGRLLVAKGIHRYSINVFLV